MSGPWEKYQRQPAAPAPDAEGPWLKYQKQDQQQQSPATPTEAEPDDRAAYGRTFLAALQRGAVDLAGLPVDTIANIGDLVRAGVGTAAAAAGRADLAPDIPDRAGIVGSSEWMANKLAATGAQMAPSNPDDPTDRALFAFGRGASSAAVAPGALPAVAANAVRGGASNVAGQLVGEATGDPALATAASMATGRAPEIAMGAVRGAVRGGPAAAQAMQERIADFERMGVSPTLGQAADRPFIKGAESVLAKAPGAVGRMASHAQKTQEGLGTSVDRMVGEIAPNAGVRRAGMTIESGVRGPGGFMDQTRATGSSLYEKVDSLIAPDVRVSVSNVAKVLPELNVKIPGAPEVSRYFQNARIRGIESGLKSDTGGTDAVLTRPGVRQSADAFRKGLEDDAKKIEAANRERRALGMRNLERVPAKEEIDAQVENYLKGMVDDRLPYEALTKLRTVVGRELEGNPLSSDVPRSKWKALYAALSKDMEAAAVQAGPQARQALSRANSYHRARIGRIDQLERVVDKAGGPEAVFNAALSGTKEGASTIHSVMKSLPLEGKRTVAATILDRMGRANPSHQNAEGTTFSAQTFLTRYHQMSDDAKRAAFAPLWPTSISDLNALSRVAASLRDSGTYMANPSGTAASAAGIATYGALGASVATGNIPAAQAIVAGLASANLGARLLTNPYAVRKLAQITKMPEGAARVELLNFATRAAKQSEDEALAEFGSMLLSNGATDNAVDEK